MTEIMDRVERKSPEDLIEYTNNPKEHPEEQVDKIASSIKNYGFVQPIVVDGDNEIIIGHGRLKAAKKLELDEVPVIQHENLSDSEIRALRLADNKVAESGWDQEMLEVELEQLQDEGFDLEGAGFTEGDLEGFDLEGEDQSEEVNKSDLELPEDLKDWKILNLYAGIGGNRRFWPDEAEITHVEYNEEIAEALRKIHPGDEVIVADAHQFLLENFEEYDFIWSSPPCPTHSRLRKAGVGKNNQGDVDAEYPDMNLYQQILFLQGYFNGKWVIENVKSWYDPLVDPQTRDRHYYWANFEIPEEIDPETGPEIGEEMTQSPDEKVMKKKAKQFGLTEEEFEYIPSPTDYPKDKIIRNMVHPKPGEEILKAAFEQKDREEDIVN